MAFKLLVLACLTANCVLLASCFKIHPRSNCKSGVPIKPSKYTDHLKQLRDEMEKEKIDAYIIPREDEHASEFPTERDKRLEFFTGFDVSYGAAIILKDVAAIFMFDMLFVDADEQLDCNWMIVDYYEDYAEWLISKLQKGNVVAVDPKLIPYWLWSTMEYYLEPKNITLQPKQENLVDRLWKDRPAISGGDIYIHDIKYAGKRWQEKVEEIRDYMEKWNATAIIISELEEIAWTFNLRGSDFKNEPFFKSYALITQSEIRLYMDLTKVGKDVEKHLNPDDDESCVSILDYTEIWEDFKSAFEDIDKVFMTSLINVALYNTIPNHTVIKLTSPIESMKQVKNPIEMEGMKTAYLRESVGIAEFFSTLEAKVLAGEVVDELDASNLMSSIRAMKVNNKGDSFTSFSAFEENGAIFRYRARKNTASRITENGTFIFDTGGQYLEGTTDICRTLHFGKPTDFQMEMYTRVLMGQIDAMNGFTLSGSYYYYDAQILNNLAREHIRALGYDYAHYTFHGLGVFGRVHDPIDRFVDRIVLSVEPGYFNRTEKFAILLESTVMSKIVNESNPYVTFEAISFVPYQRTLIKKDLLNKTHVDWLNAFHEKCKEVLVPELKGNARALAWVNKNTAPL